MKRSPWTLTVAGALVFALLPSCAPAAPSPSGEALPSPSAVEATAVPTPIMTEPAVIPTSAPAEPAPTSVSPITDFNKEPPLDEFSASIAVPDFLTEEQQDLYRRAHCLYNHMFGGETTALDEIRADVETGRDGPEAIEQDGLNYYPATGRYRSWADFDAVVHRLFTDDFWQRRNTLNGPPQRSIYKEIDGRLWMADLSKGCGYYYNEYFPDEFRLEKYTTDSVEFVVIGHYSQIWPIAGESDEEREQQRKLKYDYTIEFPIQLRLTENGWRFNKFFSTMADEKSENK